MLCSYRGWGGPTGVYICTPAGTHVCEYFLLGYMVCMSHCPAARNQVPITISLTHVHRFTYLLYCRPLSSLPPK